MSICLNMIVKNESAILRSTLENLTKYIKFSYWVICDTGSTDGTQDIIKTFFGEKKIPGELYEDKWENFGHNRTVALERAYKKSDYILIFDADDSFKGDFKLQNLAPTAIRTPNTIDQISCKFGYGDDFTWYRPVILNNNIKWKYFGVLHEYIGCIEPGYLPTAINVDGDYYIEARTIGGDRNRDDKKYYKDAILLEKALQEETDQGLKSRYTFYCAQSFRDYNDFPNAIKYYLMRTTQGCFDEEIHVSYFNAGKLMIGVNEMRKTNETLPSYSEQEIEKTLFDGWKMMRDRSECLYELAKYYRMKGDYDKGYLYAKIGSKIPFPTHRVLFLYKDVYTWRLKDELGICSYYIGSYNESIRACQKIMRTNVDQRLIQNMLFSVNIILKNITTIPLSRMVTLTKNRLLGLTLVINYNETLDLVKILINSLILNVKDIYKIERIIITSPDKKVKDLDELKITFPFFEIISYKHPSHLLGNIKSKLNRNDRYIFYLEDGWISFTHKNYFNKPLSILNFEKKFGQFIYNRENGVSIDGYLSKVEGISFPDPKDNDNGKKKYYENTKYKTPATSPVLFRREFFDAITTFETPVDESFTTIFQNEINFSKITKQKQNL